MCMNDYVYVFLRHIYEKVRMYMNVYVYVYVYVEELL